MKTREKITLQILSFNILKYTLLQWNINNSLWYRSIHTQMFLKMDVLATFIEKHLKACNFIKKRLQHKCFPVNIAKFLRSAFSQNTPGDWLLLLIEKKQYDKSQKQSLRNKGLLKIYKEKTNLNNYFEIVSPIILAALWTMCILWKISNLL